MPCFYLTPKQDDFNKIPELQVCLAEASYDVDSIVARRLRSVASATWFFSSSSMVCVN